MSDQVTSERIAELETALSLAVKHKKAAKKERDVLIAAARNLSAAFAHFRKIQDDFRLSPYIKENGRKGGSPWRELCDAVAEVTSAIPAEEPPCNSA